MGYPNWEERFEELKDYRKKYGNCLVPRNYQNNKQLGRWVDTQRQQYKKLQKGEKSSITIERISKLKSINFFWEVSLGGRRKDDEVWEQRFNELKDYRKKYGNCNVPINYQNNKQLGQWVHNQRKEYKKFQKGEHSQLTKERISKLKSIDFVWVLGRGKRVKTATVAEAEKESHKRPTQVATKGQGRKRKEIMGNALQLANKSKRQKPGPEPSSSSSQESSLNKQKKEKKRRKERPRSSQRRSNPTPDAPPSSSEIRTVIPDPAPSSRPSTSQRRSSPIPDTPPSSSEIQLSIPDAAPSSSTSWNPQRSYPSPNVVASTRNYINSRVAKEFYVEARSNAIEEEKKRTDIFFGTVDRQTHNNPKLWHVRYDDGDEEEFFEKELVKVLKFYKRHRDNDPQVIAYTKKVKAETF